MREDCHLLVMNMENADRLARDRVQLEKCCPLAAGAHRLICVAEALNEVILNATIYMFIWKAIICS